MLQYIKKKIDENNVNTNNDFDDSEMIVECAHLFQELSDLSVEGTDADSARKMVIDIPLEDDIELDSVEINIGDGRLTDIPMDAAVQESDRTEMKTFDDFYQEACVSVVKLQRETDEAHDNRITRVANSNYTQYKNQIVQEGLFGFDKISINDSVVPSVVTANFGPLSPDKPDQNYYVKLDVLFEIDKRKRLLKKQLESVNAAIDGDKFVGLSTYAFKYLNEKFPDEMKGVKSAWDVLTPKKLLVPKDPVDYLILYVQFECSFRIDGENKLLLTWSRSIKPVKNGVKANIQAIADKSAVSRMMSKKDYVQESYELSRPSRFGKTYQEVETGCVQEGFLSDVIDKSWNTSVWDHGMLKRVEHKTDIKFSEDYKKYLTSGKKIESRNTEQLTIYDYLSNNKKKIDKDSLLSKMKKHSISYNGEKLFGVGEICPPFGNIKTPYYDIYSSQDGSIYSKFFSKDMNTMEKLSKSFNDFMTKDIYGTKVRWYANHSDAVFRILVRTGVSFESWDPHHDKSYEWDDVNVYLDIKEPTFDEFCSIESESDYFDNTLQNISKQLHEALIDTVRVSDKMKTDVVYEHINLVSINIKDKNSQKLTFKTKDGDNTIEVLIKTRGGKSVYESSETGGTLTGIIINGKTVTKGSLHQEAYELSRPSRFGKTYQEAIDFGSDGVPEPSVEVAPSDETDQTNPDTTDVPAGEDTTPVDSNDVSDAIVDKVANDNEVDSGDGQDIPPTDEPPIDGTDDDTLSPTDGVDDITDIPVDGDDTGDADQQLDDLNDMGNTESEVDGDVSMDIDVENMTIDELLGQGSDKLKNMTINQLKEFLSDENNAEQIQEAFFFSNKNINNKLDVELRKTLGILNDSDMELVDILTSFRKQGKTLNKVLGKAIKNKKVYSTEEIGSLNKLNKCLITVLNAIKTEKDNNYDMTVKRLIQAFVSDSAIVGKIIESKKSKPEGAEDNE